MSTIKELLENNELREKFKTIYLSNENKQAAKILGISTDTLNRYRKALRIEAKGKGRHARIKLDKAFGKNI